MNNRNVLLVCGYSLLAAGAMACGEDSAPTSLEGVYEIQTWTENEEGCDVEGMDILASSDGFAFVRHQKFFGSDTVNAGTCPSQAQCEEEAFLGDDELRLSGLSFDRGSDSAGWEGEVGAVVSSGDSDCTGTIRKNRMTWDGATLTLRSEDIDVPPFAQSGDAEDPCPFETAVDLAATAPCSSLTVITATPL